MLPDTTEPEKRFLHLEHLDEQHRDVLIANDTHKNKVKNQYDKSVKPRDFLKGNLSCSKIRTNNPWEQENSGLCG